MGTPPRPGTSRVGPRTFVTVGADADADAEGGADADVEGGADAEPEVDADGEGAGGVDLHAVDPTTDSATIAVRPSRAMRDIPSDVLRRMRRRVKHEGSHGHAW